MPYRTEARTEAQTLATMLSRSTAHGAQVIDYWTTSAGHHSHLVAEIFTISINLSISSTFQVSRHFAG